VLRFTIVSSSIGVLLGLVCSGDWAENERNEPGDSQEVDSQSVVSAPKGQVDKPTRFATITSREAAKDAIVKLGRANIRGKDQEVIELTEWLGNHPEFLELSDLDHLGRSAKLALDMLMPMVMHNNPKRIHSELADGNSKYHFQALLEMGTLARLNPMAAREVVKGLPDAMAGSALEAISAEMDKDRLPVFVEWWRQSGMGTTDDVRAKIGFRYARFDPNQAIAFVAAEAERGGSAPEIHQKIVDSLWKTSRQDAIDYVRMLDDENATVAKQGLFSRLAGISPQLALEYVPDGLAPGDAASSLAREWAKSDAAGAADWALEHDPAAALPASLSTWLSSDPDGAELWMMSNDLGSAGSAAFALLANTLSPIRPESAFDYAQRIENGQLRRRILLKVAQNWFRRNPSPAQSPPYDSGE